VTKQFSSYFCIALGKSMEVKTIEMLSVTTRSKNVKVTYLSKINAYRVATMYTKK
jgi:hypothetical protein